MNTIGDMLNEKDFYGHYNEFVYNHDFEKVTMHYWNIYIYISMYINYNYMYMCESICLE